MSSPPHECKAPSWKLSGDGSGCNNEFKISFGKDLIFEPPWRCFACKFFSILVKTYYLPIQYTPKQIISKCSTFKRAPIATAVCSHIGLSTATAMCSLLCFGRAPNSNCSVQVFYFQKGLQQQLQCVSRLLCFRSDPNSNCSVQVLCFQWGSQ